MDSTVGLYVGVDGVRLNVERALGDECLRRSSLRLHGSNAARVIELVAALRPRDASSRDECSVSRRDGNTWIVYARQDGVVGVRARQVDGADTPECRAFEEACRELMSFAGLVCQGSGCVTPQEQADQRIRWCH